LLTVLELSDNKIDTIEPLRNCPLLVNLRLENLLHLRSISPLVNCHKLRYLKLDKCHNLISLEGVENCSNLIDLSCTETGISSIESLRECMMLTNLDLARCKKLYSLSPLINHINLVVLHIYPHNKLKDMSVLKTCSSLTIVDYFAELLED